MARAVLHILQHPGRPGYRSVAVPRLAGTACLASLPAFDRLADLAATITRKALLEQWSQPYGPTRTPGIPTRYSSGRVGVTAERDIALLRPLAERNDGLAKHAPSSSPLRSTRQPLQRPRTATHRHGPGPSCRRTCPQRSTPNRRTACRESRRAARHQRLCRLNEPQSHWVVIAHEVL